MSDYRASNFGSCLRALVAARLGHKPVDAPAKFSDPDTGYYQRGNVHEDACVAAMLGDGWMIDWQQKEVAMRVEDKATGLDVVIDGHLDGRVSLPLNFQLQRVLEIKAPNAWEQFERAYKTDTWTPLTTKYAWQTSIYQICTGLECVVACWDQDNGVRWFVIEQPIKSYDSIRMRVGAIEMMVKDGQGLPNCDQRDYPCPFPFLCTHNQDDLVDLPEISDAEFAGLARTYLSATRDESAAKKTKEKVKPALAKLRADHQLAVGQKVVLVDEDGTRVEFVWTERDMPERVSKASTQSFPSVKEVM